MDYKEYKQKKEELLQVLRENTSYEIEPQLEDQVVIWGKTFGRDWSACCQNGDMNGAYRGTPVWTNPGAEVVGFIEMLLSDDRFKCLIDHESAHEHEYLRQLRDDFLEEIVETEDIAWYFKVNEE